MLKALIKKELAQLGSLYFRNRKTGKSRSKGAVIGIVLLMVFVFLSMGMMFGGTATALASALIPLGKDVFFFAIEGLFTIAVGVIGSVFMTHAILYNAKDNEFLLSMPIEPRNILIARMFTVYLFNFIFCAVVWIPIIIVYGSFAGFRFDWLCLSILLLFVIALLVTVLTCFLGWLVALATSRIRNKSLASVVFSLLFVGGYYYLYFRMNKLITAIIDRSGAIEKGLRSWGWPIWQLGLGASGKPQGALIFTLFTVILFAITSAILSATLIRLLTVKTAARKAVYRERRSGQKAVSTALLRKELARFGASPTYILNCGMGLLMLIAAAVAILIKGEAIRNFMGMLLERFGFPDIAPLLMLTAVLLIASTVLITAPSVSLEGKNLWLVQSMPVDPKSVLMAKLNLHMLLAIIPVAAASSAICIALKLPFRQSVLTVAAALLFIWLIAEFGLLMNVLKPNFDWTNESVPIKQDMPVMFTMLFGWGATLLLAVIGFLAHRAIGINPAIAVILGIELICSVILHRVNAGFGARRFSKL